MQCVSLPKKKKKKKISNKFVKILHKLMPHPLTFPPSFF